MKYEAFVICNIILGCMPACSTAGSHVCSIKVNYMEFLKRHVSRIVEGIQVENCGISGKTTPIKWKFPSKSMVLFLHIGSSTDLLRRSPIMIGGRLLLAGGRMIDCPQQFF